MSTTTPRPVTVDQPGSSTTRLRYENRSEHTTVLCLSVSLPGFNFFLFTQLPIKTPMSFEYFIPTRIPLTSSLLRTERETPGYWYTDNRRNTVRVRGKTGDPKRRIGIRIIVISVLWILLSIVNDNLDVFETRLRSVHKHTNQECCWGNSVHDKNMGRVYSCYFVHLHLFEWVLVHQSHTVSTQSLGPLNRDKTKG